MAAGAKVVVKTRFATSKGGWEGCNNSENGADDVELHCEMEMGWWRDRLF